MKLGCNYSPQLMELMARGEAPVDYIKAGAYGLFLGELPKMRALRPVLLHGMGGHERAGMPNYEALDFARMNALLAQYGSPHLAIHLAVCNADVDPGMTAEDRHGRMAACTAHFMRNIGVPLLLENTGDSPDERTVFDLIPFVEPGEIRRIFDETGAGMLLDIAHAKVTAQFRKWDLRSYLQELPLGRVLEVHVTGAGFDEDGAPYDAHGPMGEDDFIALEWVLGQTQPLVVTLEYGGPSGFDGPDADIGILKDQLHRIRALISGRL